MHKNNEEYIAERREEVVNLASAVMTEEMPFLEGIRALNSIRNQVTDQDFDDDFMLFVAIDSETDHLPTADMRDRCSEQWLEKSDKEINDCKSFYKEQVVIACKNLITRFSVNA